MGFSEKGNQQGNQVGEDSVDELVRKFICLGMDSLDRLIRRGEYTEECKHEWHTRYGHDWPVYAVTNGEQKTI
jgi:hypothetical protein